MKAACGDVIAVEDGNEGRVRPSQRGVDIPGLGVGVIVTRHVADTGLFGKPAEFVALAVVEDVDIELVRWPVDVHPPPTPYTSPRSEGSLYVGIRRSTDGHFSGSSGNGTGVRRSSHIVCM